MVASLTRKQFRIAKAEDERQRCIAWLLPYLTIGQPKFLSKNELRSVAIAEIGASKTSFDFAWINAIEQTGRHDWYEPMWARHKPSA
jgi:hypothetical protein